MKPCIFCHPDPSRVLFEDDLVVALWDAFAVSPGHALIVPRRHVPDWWHATPDERQPLTEATLQVRRVIEERHSPEGYNLGVNIGGAGGQTVFHLHLHVIPRYAGDVPQPRGGVRWVLPEKADYLRGSEAALPEVVSEPAQTVREVLETFHRVQSRYLDFGACDTEPERVAQTYLAQAVGLDHGPPRLPFSVQDWELYEIAGADLAASALTEALQEAETALKGLLGRDPRGTLHELRDRLWRL